LWELIYLIIGGKMKVNVMKLDAGAIIPKYAKGGDAGMDLYAVSFGIDQNNNYVYGTGLAMEIPEGHVGLIFPRSSISRTAHSLRNAVGVIDSGYRGEIMLKFDINTHNSPVYEIGDRIGQVVILPYPQVEFEEVFELSKTTRGKGGFGSTGTN
jgi:dUTP pyrophosphatase